jgi:hypothetical protein
VLQGVLLLGAPFAVSDCIGRSSCPDNGYEPPLSEVVAVDGVFANGGPLDAAQCNEVCGDLGDSVVTCVRESAESVLCFARPFPCKGRRPAGLTRARSALRAASLCTWRTPRGSKRPASMLSGCFVESYVAMARPDACCARPHEARATSGGTRESPRPWRAALG